MGATVVGKTQECGGSCHLLVVVRAFLPLIEAAFGKLEGVKVQRYVFSLQVGHRIPK